MSIQAQLEDIQMKSHQEYVSFWRQALRHGLLNGWSYSESCVTVYEIQLRRYFAHFEELSVQNLKLSLMQIPSERFATRLKFFEAITCFSKFLIQEGVLEEGFPDKIKPFRPKRHIPPKKLVVDRTGLDRLQAVCDTPMDKLLLILLSHTGLRASEAAGLKLNDLHLDKGYLVVTRAKWGKTRRVGLTQTVIQTIQAFLPHRTHPAHPALMTKINGKAMDRYGILTRIEKLGEKAGVPVSPHALRRSFVTINANKGRPLPMLQIACGHSDIKTTRSYCMTSEDETIEAMKAWD